MFPTTIRTAPELDTFTSLADHQSQTPATFYNARPILHYQATGIRALASPDQLSNLPIFSEQTNIRSEAIEGEGLSAVVELVDAYISSENLTLFNPSKSIGISIPYPAIALHAIQRLSDPADPSQQVQGLYMQLELSDPSTQDDEEPEAIELTLIPKSTSEGVSDIQKLFEAVSDCSNLHPDPMDEDDEMEDAGNDSRIVFEGSVGYQSISGLPGVVRGATDGSLPPPFPGSGGWITADNVGEYFDEDGNWIGGNEGGETLGEGAGRIRTRGEMDGSEDGTNGHSQEGGEESKRPRTD